MAFLRNGPLLLRIFNYMKQADAHASPTANDYSGCGLWNNKRVIHMKTLLLIRHAKSSWENIHQPDFERSLNERGKQDAPMMANRLRQRGVEIDGFISSPAKRAQKTCKLFMEVYDMMPEAIQLKSELYLPEPDVFASVIASLDDRMQHPAIFSHNPGITLFVNTLCKGVSVDNMPTCAVFAVKLKLNHWKDFRTATKEFWFMDYPKNPEYRVL